MCLAIYKPARAVIPTEHLYNGYEANSNGCGFAYSEKGKLYIVKGLFSFNEFIKKYREKEQFPMLIHFRWATHGNTNTLNCHPFDVLNGKYALIHNGVLPIHCTIEELSDTGNFTKMVIEPMLNDDFNPRKPAFRFLMEQAIGTNNKIALMSAKGEVTIYNADCGETEDAVDKDEKLITFKVKDKEYKEQVWYSNGCYKSLTRRHRVLHKDEYDGYFEGAASPTDMATSVGEGFCGIPASQLNNSFTNRARLDTPPSIIEGFKGGTKDAKASAEVMMATLTDQRAVEKDGTKIDLTGSPNHSVNSHTVTTIEQGPLFPAKIELEIAFLQTEMNMPRNDAIMALHLDIKDAIQYID